MSTLNFKFQIHDEHGKGCDLVVNVLKDFKQVLGLNLNLDMTMGKCYFSYLVIYKYIQICESTWGFT